MDKKLKILVTGANGYIGSRVVQNLCDLGYIVIATDINDFYIDRRAIYIKCDIFSYCDNWFTYLNRPDICLHLAWRDGFIHNSNKHMVDLSKHYIFLTNLIDNGLNEISIMGTMHEVGYWEGAIDENTPCNPMSQYAVSKNALRKSIELYCMEHKVVFKWLRGFYIYSNDEFGNSIFSKIQLAAKKGDLYFPFTSGKNKYDFISASELTTQIVMTILQNSINGIINCCTGIPKSLSEQVEWYIKYHNLGIKLKYGAYPDRLYDSPCVFGSNEKIKKIIHNSEVIK